MSRKRRLREVWVPLSQPRPVAPGPQGRWSQRRAGLWLLEANLPRVEVDLRVQQILRLVEYQVCMPAVLCAEMPMQRNRMRWRKPVAPQLPNRWLQNFHSTLGESGKTEAG